MVRGDVYIAMFKTMQIIPMSMDLSLVPWRHNMVMRAITRKNTNSPKRTIKILR